LFNSGLIAPGGHGLSTMSIRGDWIQDPKGRTLIDLTTATPGPVGFAAPAGAVGFARGAGALGFGTQADLLSVSGDATLSGTILVNTLDLERHGGEQPVAIVRSDGALETSGLSIQSASGSDVVQYQLLRPKPRELDLTYAVDFAAPGVLARTN